MKRSMFALALIVLVIASIGLSACREAAPPLASSFVAVAPLVLRSGESATISVSLLAGEQPAWDTVQLALVKDGKTVAQASRAVFGKAGVSFPVPNVTTGEYTLELKGTRFSDQATVRVDDTAPLFLETDKPIYKPGQTVHIRAVALDSSLKPVKRSVTVEAQDAKGIKVFRKEVETDEYGMASLDLPLSTEPNLGVWKLAALAGNQRTELDIRVEQYVLPKYEVKVELPKEWYLASEPVQGKVKAEYSFGKPVAGEVKITASRYVGKWETYATVSKEISGEVEFEIPPVRFVTGVPGARGMGNINLEVSVIEKATGYAEKATQLLTVASTPLSVQVIPESTVFKPGLPFSFLVITETPDNKPVDAEAKVSLTYLKKDFQQAGQENMSVKTEKGKALVTVTPPGDAAALVIEVASGQATASASLEAGYSPSGNFIHLEQVSEGALRVGGQAQFKVYTTKETANLYYEVVSRGAVVFSSFTTTPEIVLPLTPQMSPSSRLLVYQILPNSEVAADYLPFAVEAGYPNAVEVKFDKEQVAPGEKVNIAIASQGQSKVGLAVVDRSVFILAENRLNLAQVMDEMERLYMKPQAELHDIQVYSKIAVRGAEDTFKEAGVVVLSDKNVPKGEEYQRAPFGRGGWALMEGAWDLKAMPLAPAPLPTPRPGATPAQGPQLAEVQRVRQFFPETWLWADVVTDAQGKATLSVEAPDTITTWMLHALAISKEKGLGIAEGQLVALQPFFLSVDLPYSAIRGEEFPVRVAIYNYLDSEQQVFVDLEPAGWFDLLDDSRKTVTIKAQDLGGVEFKIRPKLLGVNGAKVTARSTAAADSVIKTIIVAPEGVSREIVDNQTLSAGGSKTVDVSFPQGIVSGSDRAYLALTGSFLTQTIEGLDALLQMPFGCGEQNMILFAPDVYIARYLRETGQIKPEIMAKAEKLMITGYQRELTYQRNDGSFSAFGNSDPTGSLWLTAFVLKTFGQAKGLMFIDDQVMRRAADWIVSKQKADGSFDLVGFVHHQEMVGGARGNTALTAYVAIALMEAGEKTASARAAQYLEGSLAGIEDGYTAALVSYALELAGSPKRDEAYTKLLQLAQEDEDGLYWEMAPESGGDGPTPLPGGPALRAMPLPRPQTTGIEATGYATLALTKHGDKLNAGRASRWLVSKRNAYGGYGSTQDTVVALEALTTQARESRTDVDLKVSVQAGSMQKQLTLDQSNFDVLQVVEIPTEGQLEVSAEGKGEAIFQVVRRFNLPAAEKAQDVFQIDVDYNTGRVEVDEVIEVSVSVLFQPPEFVESGMVVLDISVPTGFTPVAESLDAVHASIKTIKRHEVAGRKVIFYIDELGAGDRLSFSFQARAQYPVKAKATSSQAYSYYKPELKGETLSRDVEVVAR